MADVLSKLGWVDGSYGNHVLRFHSEVTMQLVGTIHTVGWGSGLKATCRVHNECTCWIDGPRIPDGAKRNLCIIKLVEWMASGFHTAPGHHLGKARDLKVYFGMKPKT